MKEQILVIEDNSDVRKNICEILESDGYSVSTAENGLIGLELLKKQQPDLVLCDIMMPEMDGYNVLRSTREISSISATPFIFLTAKTAKEDMSFGMQLGADDYIMKPFTIAELLSRVKTRLEKRKEVIRKSNVKLKELTDRIGVPIAKELKDPLNTIVGLSEMIISEFNGMTKEEIVEFISLVHRSGLELREVVGKAMTYYDIQKVQSEPEILESLKESSKDVKSLVAKIASEEAESFGRSNDLIMSISSAHVKAPEEYFVPMMREVLNNAFKFSPKGTYVKVLGGEEAGNLMLSISDEGVGFTENQIESIGAYQTFDSEGNNGLGLGLQNAKQIAQMFDGSFKINSTKGLGTTVKIGMPA